MIDMAPEVLRPLVHARIDELSDDELAKFFLELQRRELKRAFRKLGEEFDEDWKTGRATQAKAEEAIRSHREKHPYTRPAR